MWWKFQTRVQWSSTLGSLIVVGLILQQYRSLVLSVMAAQYQGEIDTPRHYQRYPPNSYQHQYNQDYNQQPRQQQYQSNTNKNNYNSNNNYRNNNIYKSNNRPENYHDSRSSSSSSINLQSLDHNYNNRSGLHQKTRSSEVSGDRSTNKCNIWVPMDAFSKYPLARSLQEDRSNHLQLIEVCCSGYAPMRWRGSTLCIPICENCQNGLCVKPGECQCYEEFVRNDNDDCVFTCPLGCLNGRCYLDGSCRCDPGYKLDESRKFCRPICSNGCGLSPLHNCTEPEVCGCAKGYQLTDEGCQPTCTPDCGPGGTCRGVNECVCGLGYTLKDGVCQANCYQKCVNGICYSHNRCICNPGFTYHEKTTQCIPV